MKLKINDYKNVIFVLFITNNLLRNVTDDIECFILSPKSIYQNAIWNILISFWFLTTYFKLIIRDSSLKKMGAYDRIGYMSCNLKVHQTRKSLSLTYAFTCQ